MESSSSAVAEFSRPCPRDGLYDVFISFRGEDTRSGFTDYLYHLLLENEIYTFIDVDLAGKVIESLFKIIGNSRMAIVVYSEKFASSHWCLRELEVIMQRWEEKKMMMIPIFYKVGVHELKHPTEKIINYFDQHMIQHGEGAVKKWKDAVIKIGSVSGFPYKDIYGRSERDFITQVIAIIKKKLRECEEGGLESSSSKPHKYYSGPATEHHDVFISFMGRDTLYGLVNHLYKALTKTRKDIKTFMHDDRDLSKDDNLVFNVIQRSKMSVVVFSENYASSKRCLRDLVKILQCSNNTTGQVVLPIFYEVNPSDLTNQAAKGSRITYHLEKHASDEESDTVQRWRDAVTDLGNMVGWRYSTAHSYKTELADFIGELVEDISTTLNRLDEKKESTRNQQACVPQALAVQTDWQTSGPRSGVSEECWERSGESSTYDSFDASVSDELCDVAVVADAEVSEMNTALKTVVLSSNDQQHQADEVPQEDKCSSTGGEEGYSIVTSAYFQKSDSEQKSELITIRPYHLIFYVEPKKPSSSWLSLTNTTNNNVAFMLKMDTKKQLNYSINPNKGFLLPRSKCHIQVTMEAQTVLPSHHEIQQSKDTLLIHSVKAKKDSYSTNDISNLFKGIMSRFSIYKYDMWVLYVAPPPEDSSVPQRNLGRLLANKGLRYFCMSVDSIDTHPTKPWLLLVFSFGFVSIWNYETRAEEKSFRFDIVDWGGVYAKFIHEKDWIVVGDIRQGLVIVFNYNTSEKVKEFKAHKDSVRCIKVHPTSPYVLTAANDDKLVKLWNWENDWACSETFKGHSEFVTDLAFNPKDSTSFASASGDGTIKIWSFGSSVAKFTINAHDHKRMIPHVEYFVGNDNKLYLLSSSQDKTISVWDYASKTLVQTLEGHSDTVTTTLVHPKLPVIITGSDDMTIRIWNKDTYQLKLVWTCDLGQVYSIRFIQASNEVVLGCQEGMTVIKIVDTAGDTIGLD